MGARCYFPLTGAIYPCLSLNDLVSRGQQRFRDRKAEGLGGFEIDDQLDFCDLLHGEVCRLVAFENAPGITAVRLTEGTISA